MGRPGRPVLLDGSKLKNEPMREGDGRVGTWTSEDLMRMDARFCRQLEWLFRERTRRRSAFSLMSLSLIFDEIRSWRVM
jgi:hypothetical protein